MTQSTVFGVVPAGAGQQVLDDLNLSDQALATEHEGDEAPAETYPWMRWRDDTDTLLYRRDGYNSAWEILENYGATTDPTIDDDETVGYVRASLWINVTDDRVFWCTNPAAGAATWVEAGAGGAGATSVFGRTGAVVATAGDYTADQIDDGGGKVMMTDAERTTLAAISFPAKVIPLAGTDSSADSANIRAAIAAIRASGQPGEILMSGDFKIGYASDMTGIDPDTCADLKLTGRGYLPLVQGRRGDDDRALRRRRPRRRHGLSIADADDRRRARQAPGDPRHHLRGRPGDDTEVARRCQPADLACALRPHRADRRRGPLGLGDRLSPELLRPSAGPPDQSQPHRRNRPRRVQLLRCLGHGQRLRLDIRRLLRRPARRERRQ